MRFAVVGAGGIGGLIGSWMARAGCDVTLIERWREHVDAINHEGMRIDGARGIHQIKVRAITPDQIATIAPLQMVIVAVKTQDTRRALEQLLPYSTAQTAFVSMQAGYNALEFERLVGAERTIVGNPHFGGALVSPGHLEAGFPNTIWIGEWDRLHQFETSSASDCLVPLDANLHERRYLGRGLVKILLRIPNHLLLHHRSSTR